MDEEQKPQLQIDEHLPEPTLQTEPAKKLPADASRWQRFRHWYILHKKWAIPATVILVLLIVATVPWSRYKTAGLVVKKNFTIEILDSTSRTPVSGAIVKAGSVSSQTDGNGRATLRLSVGNHTVLISKKYYKEQQVNVLVPILSQKTTPTIEVDATGRQVKIVVKNLITQKTLGDVDIQVADITAKTDKQGEAIVVLPVGVEQQKANLSLKGYNKSEVDVKISSSQVLENNFTLTPSGKVYFLSKRSGKLDVMKANLDGSDAKVVVAGTGLERDFDTVLLASPNWKYVALSARRSTGYPTPQLYILSTSDDKLLSLDSGNADYTLVGWSGDSLIYYVSRRDLPYAQPGREKLKSYNAASGKTTLLNQSSGQAGALASEEYAFVMISGGNVIFAKNWAQQYENSPPQETISGKNSLSIISSNGSNYKLLAGFDASDNIQYVQHRPNAIYIWQQTKALDNRYFDFTVGSEALQAVNIDSDQFYQAYPIFYSSPSAKQTFWADSRDGKYTPFVGDADGLNPTTVAELAEYSPYGWFNDEYLLVTKNGSELYIMSAEGGKPVKVTDFQPTAY